MPKKAPPSQVAAVKNRAEATICAYLMLRQDNQILLHLRKNQALALKAILNGQSYSEHGWENGSTIT